MVESAFLKKGDALPTDAKVDIILQEKKEQLTFKILSNLVTELAITDNDFKKQLNLLYPNKYTLAVNMKHNVFALEITLDLNLVNP